MLSERLKLHEKLKEASAFTAYDPRQITAPAG